MAIRIAHALIVLACPMVLSAQDIPPAKPASGSTPTSVEPPLPDGAIRRLGDTRLRPGARIKHLAFSPDGSRLVSWGNWLYFGDRLSVWDTATGREVYTSPQPEGQLAGLGWGDDGGFAVFPRPDGFHLWTFADGAGKYPAAAKEAAAQPGGVRLAPQAAIPSSGGVLAFSPDARRVAVFRSGGTIQVFEARPGTTGADAKLVVTSPAMPAGNCLGLHFARDREAIVALTQGDKGQSAVVWDIPKGTVSDPVTLPVGVLQGTLQSLDVADDGSAVAVGLADGTIKVFELPSGKERLSVRKHDGPERGGRWSEVSAVKFVNGGRQILSAGRDNQQLVWDAKTGADVAALNGHHSWVEAVAVSRDGKRVATAGQDSLVRLWDPATWKAVLPPEGPHETVWRLEASRDGRYAAAGSGSGAYVWELASGRQVRWMPCNHKSGYVLFTPDNAIITGDANGKLSLYPIPTGDAKALAARGRLLDFTPDGKTLLTAYGTTVFVWDWPACTERRRVSVAAEVLSAAVSPDGRTAVIGLSGRSAVLVNLASGVVSDQPVKLHWFSRAAGFAAGGRVACGTVGTGAAQAESWDAVTGGLVRKFEQPPSRGGHFYLLTFAVSPDGRHAASGHSDGGVAVYETATGEMLAHFQGHRDSVISIAWAGGNRVLSAGGDHPVLVWDVSLAGLAGKVNPLPAEERVNAWNGLGTQPGKSAVKTMAALAADPDAAVTLLAERLRPVPAADAGALDRIFRDLDDKSFAVREKATRELNELGPGAIAGVRERAARSSSAEVRGRAEAFLKPLAKSELSPERVRYLRALEVLAAADTPAARRLVERLADGAGDVWETDAARQALRTMPSGPPAK